jgi:hypothetical protein
MRLIVGCVFAVVAAAAIGHADGKTDPLTGTWKLNHAKSSGLLPNEETLVINIADGVHNYAADVVDADGTVRKSENHAKVTSGPFYPATNRLTGKPNNEIMMVKVDDRTWVRVTRTLDGKASGLMMRRMAEDGKTSTSTVISLDGKVTSTRVFERQSDARAESLSSGR